MSVPASELQREHRNIFMKKGQAAAAFANYNNLLLQADHLTKEERAVFMANLVNINNTCMNVLARQWAVAKEKYPNMPPRERKTKARMYDTSKFKLVPIEEESTDGRTTRD